MYAPAQWFELTLRGHVGAQVIINHFYYAVGESDLPGMWGILDPALDFEDFVLPSIVSTVSDFTVFDQIDVEEHVSGTAVGSLALTGGNVGLRTGDVMPPFVAWGYKSLRTTRAVPSAHKRFGACAEGDITFGAAVTGFIPTLTALATAMSTSFASQPGHRTELYPVAISKRDNSVDPSVIRPVPLFEPADNWVFQKVTSQVSRRP